jgi:hypothetical protein
VLKDRVHVVNDVAAGYGNVRVAVEADKKRAGRKRVASVAGVANKRGSVDSRSTRERGACLNVMVEGGVGGAVFRARVRRGR